jgi:hypothetical protein
MTRFGHPLTTHHVDERLIPLLHLALLRIINIKSADDIAFNFVDIEIVGTD